MKLLDANEDQFANIEPLLMSQLCVCNSNKQRMSLCKYMLAQNPGTKSTVLNPQASAIQARSSLARLTDDRVDVLRLDKKLTKNLKMQILKSITTVKSDTNFDQMIVQEESDEDTEWHASGYRPQTLGQSGPNDVVHTLSMIMKIDGPQKSQNLVHNSALAKSKGNTLAEPMDFETIYAIGYNENYCNQEQDQDKRFLNSLNLEPDQKRRIKSPKILASYASSKSGSEGTHLLHKQIENMVKLFAMPSGTKYQKYTDIKETLDIVRQNLRYQLSQTEKQNSMYINQEYDDSASESPYLVNMLKSVDDTTQERYLLISVINDFHMIHLDGKNKKKYDTEFGIATTETAVAVQFEQRNFKNMEVLLNNVKVQYIQRRMEFLEEVLKRLDGG